MVNRRKDGDKISTPNPTSITGRLERMSIPNKRKLALSVLVSGITELAILIKSRRRYSITAANVPKWAATSAVWP